MSRLSRQEISRIVIKCAMTPVIAIPEAIWETLHSPLGQAVPSSDQSQPAQDAGHVYYPALGLFQQGQELEGYLNQTHQIHIHNLPEILWLHPFCGSNRDGPPSIIYQTIKTYDKNRWEWYNLFINSSSRFQFGFCLNAEYQLWQTNRKQKNFCVYDYEIVCNLFALNEWECAMIQLYILL